MGKLKLYDKEYILSLTAIRTGETRLGERVQIISNIKDLALSSCKFVLIGLPEDIGVKANLGIGGTHTAWGDGLKAFLNIQSTTKFTGEELAVLGHLDFSDQMLEAGLMDQKGSADLQSLRELVSQIDDEVESLLLTVFAAGKVPLIVGGGHNNSYPILKAFSRSFNRPVNTINLDAHTDFRTAEGRHSGNGFRYAFEEKFLDKYAIIGLHENYNSSVIIDELKANAEHFQCVFFEDFIRESTSHSRAFLEAMNFTEGLCGLEIDLDCMAGVLSSAMSPTGLSVQQVRDMIAQTTIRQLFYFHLAEGASQLDDGRQSSQTGKLLAYLLSDFIKAQL
jgi:formiminoglutamase